jgi:hypothetical protein
VASGHGAQAGHLAENAFDWPQAPHVAGAQPDLRPQGVEYPVTGPARLAKQGLHCRAVQRFWRNHDMSGLSAAAVYRYFKSKDDLVQAIALATCAPTQAEGDGPIDPTGPGLTYRSEVKHPEGLSSSTSAIAFRRMVEVAGLSPLTLPPAAYLAHLVMVGEARPRQCQEPVGGSRAGRTVAHEQAQPQGGVEKIEGVVDVEVGPELAGRDTLV